MSANHTPGPWEARFVDGLWAVCGTDDWVASSAQPDDDGNALCFMDNDSIETDKANAHLIAAAPDTLEQRDELLEALEGLSRTSKADPCFEGCGPQPWHSAFCSRARAAIAKARGESCTS